MPSAAWANGIPMHPKHLGIGISVNLRLDIYADGQGALVCADDPSLSQDVKDHREMQDALRRLWERGAAEASRRNYFKE